MENLSPIKLQSEAISPVFTKLSPNFTVPIENSFLQDGRESLGILHPGFEEESNFLSITDKEQRSFKNLLLLEDSDIGRESLGILQINNLNINFGNEDEKVPDIMLSFVENLNNSPKILDTGFLISSPSRRLISTTSQNSALSFNSTSLEYPSKIFTLTRTDQTSSIYSPTHSLLNDAKMMTTSDLECRNRIYSQPPMNSSNSIEAGQFFWSTGKPSKIKTFSTNIHPEKLVFNDDKDDMFLDSVFIEGNHIAQKIADGSFLNECFENGPLDSTPQPEWPNDLDESVKSKESVDSKTSTDSVFKAVDKLLPNPIPTNTELINKNSRSVSSNSSSKSRDAKDILQNLSDIFNTTHKSEKQKSEGLLLLNNLAEMLNNTQSIKDTVLEDSGHSSIILNDSEKHNANGVVNYNKKESVSSNKVDVSFNSETVEANMKHCLSQSLHSVKKVQKKLEKRNSSTSAMDIHSNRNNSNASLKSNDSNGSTFGTKIKSKVGSTGPKRGPLRAVIPVKEMKKGSFTPERIEQKTSQLQSKKTSTPINEPKLKPVAASTPTLEHQRDIRGNSSPKWDSRKSVLNRSNSLPEPSMREKLSKDSNNGTPTTSKLRRPSFSASSSKEKQSSSPIPSRLTEQNKMRRRNSMTEEITDSQFRTKRSNSVGKETGLMSSLRKVRENILKSPYYNQKTGILVANNSNVEKKVTFSKSFNSSIKPKKTGKENVC